jgi:hypothetical protein
MLATRAFLYISFKVPSNGAPLHVPLSEPYAERRSVSRAFFYLSPVKKSPLQVPSTGPSWREMPVTRAFFYISFEVTSKGAPLQVPLPEPP